MKATVVIAASAGGLEPLRCIIAALPVPCFGSIFIVEHIGNNHSILPSLLSSVSKLPVAFAQHAALIEPGHIYVAPPDHHMLLEPTYIRLSQGPKVNYTRPAADLLFISAAKAHGRRVMGIVLSGSGSDGAAGLHAIKEHGGMALVQRPDEAQTSSMPRVALVVDHPDAALSASQIALLVTSFCSQGRSTS